MKPKVINYLLNKIAALGFLIFIMSTYTLIAIGFDLYEFVEMINNTIFWLYMSGYALLATMLIDLVDRWKKLTNTKVFLLHAFAGFLAFLPLSGFSIVTIIAGSIGALCAFIYAIGTYLFKKKKNFVWAAIVVFPLLFGMSYIDFTEKEHWEEQVTDDSYAATFDYFHGKHEIPLSLDKGDQVTAHVSITPENGGGHGFRIRDEDNDYVVMQVLEEPVDDYDPVASIGFQFQAEETGVYRIIVTGDNLEEEIEVDWEVE